MIAPEQALIRDAREESEDEGQKAIGAGGRGEEADEEGSGASPSHLPFAPSSELPDTTTVDPSYIISLIRRLLPNNISTQKRSQNVAYSLYPVETSKLCSFEENMEGESNHMKKVAVIEANYNSGSHSIGPGSRKVDTGSDDYETVLHDKENAWEDSGCILWDLSASRTHAEFMVNNFLIEVLLASLHASKSPRITEICLGILGNLACHDATSNGMASKDGLIETVVDQLYLDDSPCLLETFRLLTVALQGSGSTLWAKALLSEQTCLRIFWIMGNTLNTMLLEKNIEFLLAVINNKEVANVLLQPWIKLGLPNVAVNLLSCEMSKLDDENKPERTSFLDPVLCLVEALSTVDCGLEMIFPYEELCRLVCRVIKLPEKYEYTSSCVSAVMIIANLLVDGQHIVSQLSLDHEFLQGLLETIPFVSDDPQARDALWCILDMLLVRFAEKDINISSLHRLVLLFLEKSSHVIEDLDGHYMEDYGPLNTTSTGAIVRTLLRIASIIERWLTRKNEKIEDTANNADAEAKAERLLNYCKKYSSLLSTPNAQE